MVRVTAPKTSAENMGWKCFFKGGNKIKDLLVHSKDRNTIVQKSGVIYCFRCGRVDCDEQCIGESGTTFAERFREHMKAPSPIHDHHNITGHELSLDNFSTVGREDQSIAGTIKEAILIRVNDPSLNRNLTSTNCHTYGMRYWSSHQN